MSEATPPDDGAGFNDPEAWGFCEVCKYEVACAVATPLTVFGKLNPHLRKLSSESMKLSDPAVECAGSGLTPPEETPYEVEELAFHYTITVEGS